MKRSICKEIWEKMRELTKQILAETPQKDGKLIVVDFEKKKITRCLKLIKGENHEI